MADVKNILLCGVGGQGTILASKILSVTLLTDPAIYILTADNIKKWLMFANSL
jgi:Pyruvate/2-oxoacid:ferredoxin oxidoreductase gamma subunit